MKIKVCGIKSLQQLIELDQLGIDHAGIILYAKSKRFPGELSGEEKQAIKNTRIKKVGVFVNASYAEIAKTVEELGLKAVQLHGDESPELCGQLRSLTTVIKVFRISSAENLEAMMAPYKNACDYFLFDTQTSEYGGSGKQFDWKILSEIRIDKPFFLSGGIGPGDAEQIKNFHHASFFGVDVNSRFETAPGFKDMEQVQFFKEQLNQLNTGKTIKQ